MKKITTKLFMLLGALLFLGTGHVQATYYLRWGDNTNNNNYWGSNAYPFSGYEDNSLYQLSIDYLPANTEFKLFDTGVNGNEAKWYGNGAITNPIDLGKTFTIQEWNDGGNIKLGNEELWNVTISFIPNDSWNRFDFTINASKSKFYPILYLLGNVNGNNWSYSKGVPATSNNGVYTWNNVTINNADGYGYFNISSITGNDYKEVEKSIRFAPTREEEAGDDVNLTPGSANAYKNNIGPGSWYLTPGQYDITLDLTKSTYTISAQRILNWTNNDEIVSDTHNAIYKVSNEYELSGHEGANYTIEVQYNGKPSNTQNINTLAAIQKEDYTVDGNTVTLNKAGTYTLTAKMQDGSNTTSTLNATVSPLDITLSTEDDLTKAWQTGDVAFSYVLNTTSSTSPTFDDSDFSIEVTPSSGINTETMPSTRPNNFIVWEWDQMKGLIDSDKVVDGYYEDITENQFNSNINGQELEVSGHFPVSGEYNIIVTSNDEDINISNGTTTVKIYPNTGLIYSDYTVTYIDEKGQTQTSEIKGDDGININGMQVKDNIIEYYFDNTTNSLWGDAENARFYTPGIYLATVRYSLGNAIIDNPTSANLTEEGQILDISALSSSNPLYLYYEIVKNGVSSGINQIKIETTTSAPLAVDTIGVDEADGEAIYYNLQGVRVANPEHGIFVKVVNGKASKVVM